MLRVSHSPTTIFKLQLLSRLGDSLGFASHYTYDMFGSELPLSVSRLFVELTQFGEPNLRREDNADLNLSAHFSASRFFAEKFGLSPV